MTVQVNAPMTSASGRFFFASRSSELMEVAIIQPSYAKAKAVTPANMPEKPPPFSADAAAPSASTVAVLPFVRPTIVPTTPMSISGMSLIIVIETWSLPASFGLRELMP